MSTRVFHALSILLAGLLCSCTDVQRNVEASAPLTFRDSTVTVMADTCTDSTCSVDDCGGVSVVLAVPNSSDPRWDALRRTCAAFHADVLEGRDTPRDTIADISAAGRRFMLRFASFRAEFPETPGFWTMQGRDTVLRSDSLICIRQEAYTFTGGAHGATTSRFVIARTRDGAVIPWSDLATDTVTFRTAAETAFRATVGMQAGESYTARGYWFENERFVLAREIGIDTSGFVLEYQHYEIAPYSMGQLRVHVPFIALSTKR